MAAVLSARELSTTWFDGNRRRQLILIAFVVALSAFAARMVLALDVGAVAVFAVMAAVAAVAIKPRNGLYLMLALVLLFDGGRDDPVTLPGYYVFWSLQTTLHLNGAIVIPYELLVLLTLAAWLAHSAMRGELRFQGGALAAPMLAFTLAIGFGVVRGLIGGGNPNYSFWESRFLVTLPITYVLATNLVRTRAHVRTLLAVIFVCVGASAADGVWRKFALINTGLLGTVQETWYAHDALVVWGLLVMLVLAQLAFGGPRWQRFVGPALALVALMAMLVSERRAGLIAVMIAFALYALSLLTVKRRSFYLIAVPVVVVGAIYLPLFWNNGSSLGQGARAVRSLYEPDERDAASNAWRGLEAINVRATIASDPILGIGFGRPFLQIVTVPDISFFEFWNYEAHHNILWIWMKTGVIGFTSFFFLILAAIARSIWLAKTQAYPELRTFAIVAMSAIVMGVVFCYVDIGFSADRIPMLLGLAIGTVSGLDRLSA